MFCFLPLGQSGKGTQGRCNASSGSLYSFPRVRGSLSLAPCSQGQQLILEVRLGGGGNAQGRFTSWAAVGMVFLVSPISGVFTEWDVDRIRLVLFMCPRNPRECYKYGHPLGWGATGGAGPIELWESRPGIRTPLWVNIQKQEKPASVSMALLTASGRWQRLRS